MEPGMWYYAASFFSDCLGDGVSAMKYAAKAEQSRKSQFIDESVKVLRMYLHAKYGTIDEAYESKLFEQIKWLDRKIVKCITPNVRKITSEGYEMHWGFSYYYWNDMLRKIVLGYVAPKMDRTNPVLSLRLRNMADNRLLNLVDCFATDKYDDLYGYFHPTPSYTPRTMSMKEYREDSGMRNMFDYSNYFFKAMDEMDIQHVVKYEKSMGRGATDMDRFLDERGYVNHDYVRELIGTRYIRERNYSEAVRYLSSVSASYESTTNVHVYGYLRRESFSYKQQDFILHPKEQNKLSFAREMFALERQMKSAGPDEKGVAMFRYGLGLRSSFGDCWALTQYHKNLGDTWLDEPYTKKAVTNADNYIITGLRTIKNPETAAREYMKLYLMKTVLKKYPQTKAAEEIRAQCDKLNNGQISGILYRS